MPEPPSSRATMFTTERRVGRLVEARIFRLATAADVDAYARDFAPLLGGKPTLLADHSRVAVYSQEVTDRLVSLFTSLNVHWERVAIVVAPTNATLLLQLRRVVRESNNPSRLVFVEAAAACKFLAEGLDAAELARATAFLADP